MADTGASSATVHVALNDVGKMYGHFHALRGISVQIERASVHALVGENGAGKSTLGQIVAGAMRPTSGSIDVDGAPVRFRSPRDALSAGIVRISQELSLLPERSVIENVFLGCEPATARFIPDRASSRRQFATLVERSGLDVPARARVRDLTAGDQQKVEILRALARSAELIVMDEPTASLSRVETVKLLETIRWLSSIGTTVVFVSHFLGDVLDVADRVTVLRDGRMVRTRDCAGATVEGLVEDMLGRPMTTMFPESHPPRSSAPVRLAITGMRAHAASTPVDLTIAAGEIVGMAGLVGSGRTELARMICGADRAYSKSVSVDGVAVSIHRPGDAKAAGIAMLPESRRLQGLHLMHSVAQNIALPALSQFQRGGFTRGRDLSGRVDELVREVGIQPPDGKLIVGQLSGGNQQKTLFAKMLVQRPKVLIVDEPTRGVDVGGKRAIYELITALAAQGTAVLLISSEIEEILGLAHRVIALKDGAVVKELTGALIDERAVLRAIFGKEEEAA